MRERLRHLSTILPVFAQELAAARRQAARLRVENARLLEEIARLRAGRAGENGPAAEPGSGSFGGERLLAAVRPALDGERRGERGTALRA